MITNVKGMFREFETSFYTTSENFMTSGMDFTNPVFVDAGKDYL
jgi:hypothetical protein